MLYHCFASFKQSLLDFFKVLDSRLILIGVDLTDNPPLQILGGLVPP